MNKAIPFLKTLSFERWMMAIQTILMIIICYSILPKKSAFNFSKELSYYDIKHALEYSKINVSIANPSLDVWIKNPTEEVTVKSDIYRPVKVEIVK